MAEAHLRQWAGQRIAALLQMPADSCNEIVENILAYDDADELKSFLVQFTESNAEYKVNSFVDELFERRSGPKPVQQDKGRGKGSSSSAGGGRGSGGSRSEVPKRPPPKKEEHFPKLDMPVRPRKEGDKRLLVIDAASGRHNVLTNCLNCGKVIVEEEGWGPCLFCGNPIEVADRFGVRRGDDRGVLDSVGEANTEESKYNESFQRAVATKDRLLSYDRDAKKRTKVYDDATDWYSESVNPWLSEKQREEAMQKGKEEERRRREEKRKIHAKIDLFGRTVISADAEVEAEASKRDRDTFQDWTENVIERDQKVPEVRKGLGGANSQLSADSQQLYDRLRASLHAAGKESWSGTRGKASDAGTQKKGTRWDASIDSSRVEDEFAAVSVGDFAKAASSQVKLLPAEESPYADADDTGQCLSMHQPWASLLVHGFKRAEGRGWKTDHRGRLWIHAAGKPPDEFEVESLEQRYRSIYEAQGVPIPPLPSECGGYPTSALIGCVDIEECFTKEEYSAVLAASPSMPQEENDCEYIFWCLRPRRLLVPLKMGGDHKIWRLPKTTLAAAQHGLRPVRWPAPPGADGQSEKAEERAATSSAAASATVTSSRSSKA